jgi:hypothetical protein
MKRMAQYSTTLDSNASLYPRYVIEDENDTNGYGVEKQTVFIVYDTSQVVKKS